MRYLLLLLVCSCISTGYSQDQDIKWGPTHELSTRSYIDIFHIEKDNYFVFQTDNEKPILYEYSREHKLVNSYELPGGNPKQTLNYKEAFATRSGVFAFREYYDTRKKKWKFDYCKLNTDNLKEHKPLFEYDFKFAANFLSVIAPKETYQNFGVHYFDVSQDKSKVAIFKDRTTEIRGSENSHFVVFDEDMNLLWDRKVTYEYSLDHFKPIASHVSNDGIIAVLAHIYKRKNNKKYKGYEGDYHAIIVDKDGYEDYELDLGNGVIPIDVSFLFSSNDSITFIGYYGRKSLEEIEGTFLAKMSLSDRNISVDLKKFNDKFLEAYGGKNNKTTLKKEHQIISQIFSLENGTKGIVSEQVLPISDTRGNIKFFYGNLIVSLYDKNDRFKSHTVVPKKMRTSHYSLAPKKRCFPFKNKLHVFYYNLDEGIKMGEVVPFTDYTVINHNGEIEGTKRLGEVIRIKSIIHPKLVLPYNDEFLLGSLFLRRKHYTVGSMDL